MTKVTTVQGNTAKKTKTACEFNIIQLNPIKIFNKVCPAIILANNRMDKLKIREKYEINSTAAINGAKIKGEPVGIPKEKIA